MSGHSKWSNIKHKKAAQDSKRSNLFQKLTKEILVAAKSGGNDPEKNSKLRFAIEKAKSYNLPNDNIKKLLDKSNKDTSNFSEITYEGYGPGGIAILVECLTDNINRTAAVVKSSFGKLGGNLGTSGSVAYLFETKGQIVLDKSLYNIDDVLEIVLELDILDFYDEENVFIIETLPNNFISVKESLEKSNIKKFLSSEVTKIPKVTIEVNENVLPKVERLIDALETNDDVQMVYTNLS